MTEQAKSNLKTVVWLAIIGGLAYGTFKAFQPVAKSKSVDGVRKRKTRKKK